MPARVVVVHDEPEFAGRLVSALRSAGHDVTAFTAPLATWDVVTDLQRVDVLITRVVYPPGQSNGVTLAMKVPNQPEIHVLLTGGPQSATSMLISATVANIVKTVGYLLDFADAHSICRAEDRSLPNSRQAEPGMPKYEPEVARILQQGRCATCRYWGEREEGVFKRLASRTVPARRCGVDPQLATSADDRCNAWRRS